MATQHVDSETILPGTAAYKRYQDEVWEKAKDQIQAAIDGVPSEEGASFYVPSQEIVDFMSMRTRMIKPTAALIKEGDVSHMSQLQKLSEQYENNCESLFTPGAHGAVHKDIRDSANFATFPICKVAQTLGIFHEELRPEDLLITLVENVIAMRARGMLLWKDTETSAFTCNHLFSKASKYVGCPQSLYAQVLERCPCFWIHSGMLYQQIAIDHTSSERYMTWAHHQEALAAHFKITQKIIQEKRAPTEEEKQAVAAIRNFGFLPSDGKGQNPPSWTLQSTPIGPRGVDLQTAYRQIGSDWIVTNSDPEGEFKKYHQDLTYYATTLGALNEVLQAYGSNRQAQIEARNLITDIYLSKYKVFVGEESKLPEQYNSWLRQLKSSAVDDKHLQAINAFVDTPMGERTAAYRISRIETFQLLVTLPYDFKAWRHATETYSAYSGFHSFEGSQVSVVNPSIRSTSMLVSDFGLAVYLSLQEFKQATEAGQRERAERESSPSSPNA